MKSIKEQQTLPEYLLDKRFGLMLLVSNLPISCSSPMSYMLSSMIYR